MLKQTFAAALAISFACGACTNDSSDTPDDGGATDTLDAVDGAVGGDTVPDDGGPMEVAPDTEQPDTSDGDGTAPSDGDAGEVDAGAPDIFISACAGGCDSFDPCVAGVCNEDTGACESEVIYGCGANHPCKPSPFPRSSNLATTLCVCDQDPTCCTEDWDDFCVLLAQQECGTQCGCDSVPPSALDCRDDSDCVWCSELNFCEAWTCDAGSCVQQAAVTCDTSQDTGCFVTECQPLTGTCPSDPMPSDDACDDGEPCTLDYCDLSTKTCVNEAIEGCGENEPCQVSSSPGSSDAQVTDCVCNGDPTDPDEMGDPYCCATSWDSECVQAADTRCDAGCVDCSNPLDARPCTGDADCEPCEEDTDLCNGSWSCDGGFCVESEPVVCASDPGEGGCVANLCDPDTGECGLTGDDDQCVQEAKDAGVFTGCERNICDTESKTCTTEAIDGACEQPPCQSLDGSGLPGSNDDAVMRCVCGSDDYCCLVEWDFFCVVTADQDCNAGCSCEAAFEAEQWDKLACSEDAVCDPCEDGDPCNGTWKCLEGICTKVGPDEELCSAKNPCAVSPVPYTTDPAINECACEEDPWCCERSWDPFCVDMAEVHCGLVCDCTTQPPDSCTRDDDCSWCDDGNLCNGTWICDGGQCRQAPSDPCPTDDDTECIKNTCDPATGACAMERSDATCYDLDICTLDYCSAAGSCQHEPIDGCN